MTHPSEGTGRLILPRCLVLTVIALMITGLLCARQAPSPPAAAEITPIKHTLGLYGLRGPESVAAARRTLPATVAIGDARAINGVQHTKDHINVIDISPQKIIYRAMCPSGPKSCHHLSNAEMKTLKRKIRQAVRQNFGDPSVIGYYLVDDYWFDMSEEIRAASHVIRALSPKTVLTCAFGLNVATTRMQNVGHKFSSKLVNYSPSWCDAIVIYSYSPPSDQPIDGHINWNMSSTLQLALTSLREHGWTPANGLLIGTPQAFNFNPRITRSPGPTGQEFRAVTGPMSLRTQVTAFCQAGAQSIIAYTWENKSPGEVTVLSNDPGLRKGLREGMSNCQDIWLRQMARPLADHI